MSVGLFFYREWSENYVITFLKHNFISEANLGWKTNTLDQEVL